MVCDKTLKTEYGSITGSCRQVDFRPSIPSSGIPKAGPVIEDQPRILREPRRVGGRIVA